MAHKMFRYLSRNYCGTYRVRTHAIDLDTLDFPRAEDGSVEEEVDDEYIDCQKGEIRASYRQTRGVDILCWYVSSRSSGNNMKEKINKDYPDMWIEIDDVSPYDYYIYFNADDISKMAKLAGARTSGASIRTFSNKNLPRIPYIIPEVDLKKYNDIIAVLELQDKMIYGKRVFNTFIEKLANTKQYSKIITEFKSSHMKVKDFVHKNGLWEQFIPYATEYLEIYLKEKEGKNEE